jgi:hypothetical protein
VCLASDTGDSGYLGLHHGNVLWHLMLGNTAGVPGRSGCVCRTGGVDGPYWLTRGSCLKQEFEQLEKRLVVICGQI